jgi:hypothetical protein
VFFHWSGATVANTRGHSFRDRLTLALQYGQSARDWSHCSRHAEWKMCLHCSCTRPSAAPWHPSRHIEQSTEDSLSPPSIVIGRVSSPSLETGLVPGATPTALLQCSAVFSLTLSVDREALELKRMVWPSRLLSFDVQTPVSEERWGAARMVGTASAVCLQQL